MAGRQEALSAGREFLAMVRKPYNISMAKGVEGELKKEMGRIKTQFNIMGYKTTKYYSQAYLDIQTQILRHAFVHALLRSELSSDVEILPQDINEAMELFYPSSLDTAAWINSFVIAQRDMVVPLRDRDKERSAELVLYMRRRGAVEQGTALPVQQIKNWIVSKGWYKSTKTSHRFWSNLLKYNIIRTEKVGNVWVAWIGGNGYEVLNEVVESGISTKDNP